METVINKLGCGKEGWVVEKKKVKTFQVAD